MQQTAHGNGSENEEKNFPTKYSKIPATTRIRQQFCGFRQECKKSAKYITSTSFTIASQPRSSGSWVVSTRPGLKLHPCPFSFGILMVWDGIPWFLGLLPRDATRWRTDRHSQSDVGGHHAEEARATRFSCSWITAECLW